MVPTESGALNYSAYNRILRDFVDRLANPAASAAGFRVETSRATQSILDWLKPDTAQLLARFSACANKSTGASHPLDQERWIAFLISAHQHGADMDAGQLARWLVEGEHWPEEEAGELALQYEFSGSLLRTYDGTK